jgi:hypothetical protein
MPRTIQVEARPKKVKQILNPGVYKEHESGVFPPNRAASSVIVTVKRPPP